MAANSLKSNIHWQELDILRGLAVVLMVLNHVGVRLLSPTEANNTWVASLLFIGSFAPVLFFFVTGVGYGIQSVKKKNSRWSSTLNKVAILLLADLLMHWSSGRLLGLDFLGFIGFSILVLELLRKASRPLIYCLIGIATVFCLRYVLGPKLPPEYIQSWVLLDWIIGVNGIPGISYPFSPWITYPLTGYLVGALAMQFRSYIERFPIRVISGLIAIGILPTIISLILSKRGAIFFRWGTVSIGFYIVSFATLLFSLAFVLTVAKEKGLETVRGRLALKGVASLAVVPIHYFLIEAIAAAGWINLSGISFLIIFAFLLAISWISARTVEKFSQKLHQISKQKIALLILILIVLLASGVTLMNGRENAPLVLISRTVGQIALCLLFTIRMPEKLLTSHY